MKLPAFARTRPLLFSRTLLSNLLNKIQFTFEAVPCLILGLFRRFFRRCASILAQCYEGVGGREEGRGGWGGGVGRQMVLTIQPGRRDIILVKGRIPG